MVPCQEGAVNGKGVGVEDKKDAAKSSFLDLEGEDIEDSENVTRTGQVRVDLEFSNSKFAIPILVPRSAYPFPPSDLWLGSLKVATI